MTIFKTVGDVRKALEPFGDDVAIVTYNSTDEGGTYELLSLVKPTVVSNPPGDQAPRAPRFGLSLDPDAWKLGAIQHAVLLA